MKQVAQQDAERARFVVEKVHIIICSCSEDDCACDILKLSLRYMCGYTCMFYLLNVLFIIVKFVFGYEKQCGLLVFMVKSSYSIKIFVFVSLFRFILFYGIISRASCLKTTDER